jgi:hypothetical protein
VPSDAKAPRTQPPAPAAASNTEAASQGRVAPRAGAVAAAVGGARRAITPANERRARDEPRRAAPAGTSSERTGSARVSTSTLGEEIRLMEQAMRALGEGDRELARSSLDEHARRFPAGLLERERERALTRLREAGAEPRTDAPH